MLQVAAAVIERDGRVLICQRTERKIHPLKWEFPGGKVEPGESPEQGLARELEEELGIMDAEGLEMMRYNYAYPGRPPVTLIFFRVLAFSGEPQNLEFHEIRWEPGNLLGRFDFVEGDRQFLAAYVAGITNSTAAEEPAR